MNVWCNHCAQPAAYAVRLANGEWASYCQRCISRLTLQPGMGGLLSGEDTSRVRRIREDDPSIQHEGTYES